MVGGFGLLQFHRVKPSFAKKVFVSVYSVQRDLENVDIRALLPCVDVMNLI